jgi:hypothetical protein
MIDRRREGDQLREEFSVLGSTGNVSVAHPLVRCKRVDDLSGIYRRHRQEAVLQLYEALGSLSYSLLMGRRSGRIKRQSLQAYRKRAPSYTRTALTSFRSCSFSSKVTRLRSARKSRLLRAVLQVPQSSDMWYQRYAHPILCAPPHPPISSAQSPAHLRAGDPLRRRARGAQRAGARPRPTSVRPRRGPARLVRRRRYARDTSHTLSRVRRAPAGPKRRVPGPDDDCPICYEGMHGVADAKLTFCERCGNGLHKECFQQCACPPVSSCP